jgi:cell division protein FtsI (penicillin-binding protein 3)
MAWRHFTLVSFFVLAGIGLVVRVVFLNVTEGKFLIDQGERRSVKAQQIAAHRGVIYDRFGEPLAVSTPAAAVYTNPREGLPAEADLTTLCRLLDMDCPRLRLHQARGCLGRRAADRSAQPARHRAAPGVPPLLSGRGNDCARRGYHRHRRHRHRGHRAVVQRTAAG